MARPRLLTADMLRGGAVLFPCTAAEAGAPEPAVARFALPDGDVGRHVALGGVPGGAGPLLVRTGDGWAVALRDVAEAAALDGDGEATRQLQRWARRGGETPVALVSLELVLEDATERWRLEPAGVSVFGGPARPVATSAEAVGRLIAARDARQVIVMAGAGISVAAGICDFRTPVTGLYANLGKYRLEEPEDLFTMETLEERPELFYTVCEDMSLWPGRQRPVAAHHMMAALAAAGRLRRVYTQNIDGLERLAGLDPELLVEAHGTFATAACVTCHAGRDVAQCRAHFAETGRAMRCPVAGCGGIVKPEVVFFGEALPVRFHDLADEDFAACDMLVVMGTSLTVFPFASLAGRVRPGTPCALLNRDCVGPFEGAGDCRAPLQTHGFVAGDCQEAARRLCAAAGLGADLERRLRPPADEAQP